MVQWICKKGYEPAGRRVWYGMVGHGSVGLGRLGELLQ